MKPETYVIRNPLYSNTSTNAEFVPRSTITFSNTESLLQPFSGKLADNIVKQFDRFKGLVVTFESIENQKFISGQTDLKDTALLFDVAVQV